MCNYDTSHFGNSTPNLLPVVIMQEENFVLKQILEFATWMKIHEIVRFLTVSFAYTA